MNHSPAFWEVVLRAMPDARQRRKRLSEAGRGWVDFEAGDRSEVAFLRLYERLPDAELYRSDAYSVYRA